ncbi:MAG: MarR family transcriptional regulator [Steroidobacteraceae bacterium]
MTLRRATPPRIPDDDELTARNPGQRVGLLLRNLHHALRQHFDESLRRSSVHVSLPQMLVLFTLHRNPGIQGARVARFLCVTPQTASALLKRLEDEGYVARRPSDANARADCWSLTGRGTTLVARAIEAGEPVTSRMVSGLSAREVGALAGLLERCVVALAGPAAPDAVARPRRRRVRGAARPRARN